MSAPLLLATSQSKPSNLAQNLIVIISDYKMADGSGADLQQYMKKDGDPTPFILFTNTIEPSLLETSENFLGIIEKRDWKILVDLIKEVQSNNT